MTSPDFLFSPISITENVSATDRKQGCKLWTKVIFCNIGIFPEVGHHHFWTAHHHKSPRSPRLASNITRLSPGDFTIPHKFGNLLLYNTIATLLMTVCFCLSPGNVMTTWKTALAPASDTPDSKPRWPMTDPQQTRGRPWHYSWQSRRPKKGQMTSSLSGQATGQPPPNWRSALGLCGSRG